MILAASIFNISCGMRINRQSDRQTPVIAHG